MELKIFTLLLLIIISKGVGIDDEIREKQRNKILEVQNIIDSAVKDENGMISRQEYGRVLKEIVQLRGRTP